jgi:hypothetical protein
MPLNADNGFYKKTSYALANSPGRPGIKIMRKVLLYTAIAFLVISPSAIIRAETLLYDDFSGDTVSSSQWHIPTWVSPTDGTVVGLTQFRYTQNASLPAARNGNAMIALETYNPTALSFYGTDLRSNQSFALGTGVHITEVSFYMRSNQEAPPIMMKSILNFSRIYLMAYRPTFTATKN